MSSGHTVVGIDGRDKAVAGSARPSLWLFVEFSKDLGRPQDQTLQQFSRCLRWPLSLKVNRLNPA
jgi:hypothetical protein